MLGQEGADKKELMERIEGLLNDQKEADPYQNTARLPNGAQVALSS